MSEQQLPLPTVEKLQGLETYDLPDEEDTLIWFALLGQKLAAQAAEIENLTRLLRQARPLVQHRRDQEFFGQSPTPYTKSHVDAWIKAYKALAQGAPE